MLHGRTSIDRWPARFFATMPRRHYLSVVSHATPPNFSIRSYRRAAKTALLAVQKFGGGLLDLALPPRCLRCDDDLTSAMRHLASARNATYVNRPETGRDCCRPLRSSRAGRIPPVGTPFHMQGFFAGDSTSSYALGRYRGLTARCSCCKTKRLSSEAVSLSVGRLMAAAVRGQTRRVPARTAVVPIPMHWVRRIRSE